MQVVDNANSQAGQATSSFKFPPLRQVLREVPAVAAKSLAVGVIALGITFLIPPTYTARTLLLPPQSQQGGMSAAVASLGALAGLAGGSIKTPGDQYVSMLQSENVTDRLIDKFKLQEVYRVDFRTDARKRLGQSSRIGYGKKDGLISIEVDDHDPQRAADLANQYVTELSRLSNEFTLSEAQQRRVFFEAKLKEVNEKLKAAQVKLQSGGLDPRVIKAEPKAAAEGLAKLSAELTAGEVRLEGLRQSMTNQSVEVQRQQATVAALRAQIARLGNSEQAPAASAPDYLGSYRDFKYYEALFDIFARQYELARADEAKEGPSLQVIDVARAPERRTSPKRAQSAILATLAAAFVFGCLHLRRLI